MDLVFLKGDARKLPLEDGTVQCVVTSPPYWGLRKYSGDQELIWEPAEVRVSDAALCASEGHVVVREEQEVEIRTGLGLEELSKKYRGGGKKQGEIEKFTVVRGLCARCGAWVGAYGLEPTVEMYVEHTVDVLREVRRVLRKDGVVFWNLGDSYAAGKHNGYDDPGWNNTQSRKPPPGLKPKDICLIPQRVAIAAQMDGWWVRSMIVWAKSNPMPESVTDRPTNSWEHIIMLTKSENYFWDADAVRENVTGNAHDRGDGINPKAKAAGKNSRVYKDRDAKHPSKPKQNPSFSGAISGGLVSSRNMRNIWTFASQPYAEAHFATFPEELPRRCILAATSERGSCRQCGAPWERVVRVTGGTIGKSWHGHENDLEEGLMQADGAEIREGLDSYDRQTVGCRPTCMCRGQHGITEPCLVLDPFAGSGTTGRVAIELNRRAVLNDLAYQELAEKRTSKVQRNLF